MNLLFHGSKNSELFKVFKSEGISYSYRMHQFKPGLSINHFDAVVSDAQGSKMQQLADISESAVEAKIPVYIFCEKDNGETVFPVVIGADKDLVSVIEYSRNEIQELVKKVLKSVSAESNERFSFLVPKSINSYLEWISKEKDCPKSTFMRRVLEDKAKSDKAYHRFLTSGIKK